MVRRSHAAKPPCFGWKNSLLEIRAKFPPRVPESLDITHRRRVARLRHAGWQKVGEAEKNRGQLRALVVQLCQWRPLRQGAKRHLVRLIAERFHPALVKGLF